MNSGGYLVMTKDLTSVISFEVESQGGVCALVPLHSLYDIADDICLSAGDAKAKIDYAIKAAEAQLVKVRFGSSRRMLLENQIELLKAAVVKELKWDIT